MSTSRATSENDSMSSNSVSSLDNSSFLDSEALSKFDSSFSPWVDYVFGSVLLFIGKFASANLKFNSSLLISQNEFI